MDYSLYPDDQGERDYVAVIVSVQKLDYNLVNDAINRAQGATYDQKVGNALQGELAGNIQFRGVRPSGFPPMWHTGVSLRLCWES